jgi:hypothetical protein
MSSEILFSQALGLQSPWKVEEICFSSAPNTFKNAICNLCFDKMNDPDPMAPSQESIFVPSKYVVDSPSAFQRRG